MKLIFLLVLCTLCLSTKAQTIFGPIPRDTNRVSMKIWDGHKERWIYAMLVCQQDGWVMYSSSTNNPAQKCKVYKYLTENLKPFPKQYVVIQANGCPKKHTTMNYQ